MNAETSMTSLSLRHLLSEVENQVTSSLGAFVFDPVALAEKDQVTDSLLSYFKRLEANGSLKAGDTVVRCGTATSTATLRDRPNKPHYRQIHCAVVHYTDGVQPRVIRVQGKWRKAKAHLRNWLAAQRNSVAADTFFQPAQPASYIKFQLAVLPTKDSQ